MHPEVMKATDLLQINTPECFEEAVRLLRHTVYRFSVKICRHPEDAEDTTQEVIFRSLRHFGRFKDPQSLSVWLYVVTRNRYRRMRRQNAHCLARVIPLDQLLLTREETTPLLTDIRKSPEATMLELKSLVSFIGQSCESRYPCALFLCSMIWRSSRRQRLQNALH